MKWILPNQSYLNHSKNYQHITSLTMTPFPVQIQSYPNVELSSYFSEPALFLHSYCLHLTNLLKTPWIFTLYFYFIYVSLGRRIMSYSSCSPQTLSLSTVGFYWLFLHLYNCLINDLVIFSIFIFFLSNLYQMSWPSNSLFSVKNPYHFPV